MQTMKAAAADAAAAFLYKKRGRCQWQRPRCACRNLLQVEESVLAQVLSHIAQQSHRKL